MMKKTPTSTKDSLPNKEMNDLPRLASAVLPLCSQHPGQCGLFPLEKSLDAFAAIAYDWWRQTAIRQWLFLQSVLGFMVTLVRQRLKSQ